MRRIITIFLVLFLLFPLCSRAEITKMIGRVKGCYNFWLYQPNGVTASPKLVSETSEDVDIYEELDLTGGGFIPAGCEEPVEEQIANEFTETQDSGLKPLVVFLHGRSLCGNNLNKVLKYGTIAAVKMGLKLDAYAIAPQNPGEAWKPDKIAKIIDWVSERYAIDTDRIYVLGMSLGGFGTIDFVAAYPEKVAAAIAMCGGGYEKDLSGLNEVPLWILHGTADAAVSVNESRKVKRAMEAAGETPLLRYDEWKGANHSVYARMFYHPKAYQWLFKHNLQVREVDRTISITNNDLKNAYRLARQR